nr:TRAP transporter fused permease subunit [Thalassobaculum salexigens]
MSEPIMNTSAGGDAVTDTIRHRVLTPGWTVVIMAMTAAAVLLSIYQLFNIGSMVGWVILDLSYLDLMVALLLPIVFLVFPMRPSDKNRRTPPIYDLALFAGTFVLGCYLAWIAVPAVEGGWEYFAPASARILGFVLWALMIEAVRRTGGLALTIIVLIFSFYPPFAESMPGPLQGAQQSLWEVSQYYLFSSEAIFGIPMRAFGKLVIGFVIFGVALQHTGAGRFFIDLAFALLGNVRGGGAKVAIFSSGLLGSMSGSVITNVLTTGRLTIPAMRRTGFGKETAAAVEACASTGGVLMPPVMGATAFVMASFLNVPYIEIAVAAVIPSLLYYLGLFLQIDAYAARKSLKGLPREELPKLGAVFRRGWHYLFALVLLVYLLLYMKQEALAPYYATAVLLIANQIFGKRLGWSDLKHFLYETGQVLAELVVQLTRQHPAFLFQMGLDQVRELTVLGQFALGRHGALEFGQHAVETLADGPQLGQPIARQTHRQVAALRARQALHHGLHRPHRASDHGIEQPVDQHEEPARQPGQTEQVVPGVEHAARGIGHDLHGKAVGAQGHRRHVRAHQAREPVRCMSSRLVL